MADRRHNLLIIYTSKNGSTGDMVEPIRQGILGGGAIAVVRTVQEVQWEEMLAAKGIIVVARQYGINANFSFSLKV